MKRGGGVMKKRGEGGSDERGKESEGKGKGVMKGGGGVMKGENDGRRE